MSTRTSVRPAVQAAIAAALTTHTALTGVKIMDGANPRDAESESIAIGNVRSVDTGIAFMTAGRKQRKDQFVFDVEFWAQNPGQSGPDSKLRCAEMFGALEDLLADNPTLDRLIATPVQWLQISSYEGPDTEAAIEGFGAYLTAHVECLSELI